MGAQRWIDLKVFHLQPSELMKIALVLSLARYFHRLSLDDVARSTYLVFPILLVAAPVALVMRQPDLARPFYCSWAASPCSSSPGCASGNLSWSVSSVFRRSPLHGPCCMPIKKQDHDLLSPESDPLGAGYHALQSFIALGSGGISGKGF